ncbi:MAG TPA: orotidine-5'-phosphate decarboxylase [Nitrospiraceae bacterium]|jgi:orotidine-5'-phosphate decarboxylase|nr:orotidine-5'-phosphate decarboxylase [Nitrospiraceae bacterium]
MEPRERIILALDVSEYEDAVDIVRRFKGHIDIFKIGSELFTSVGPRVIKEIHLMGKKVFLDLKFHDIPNTVAKSALAAAKLGVFMFNVHTLGGYQMMKHTAETLSGFSLEKNVDRPRLIGVTILTSINQNALRDELGVTVRMNTQVKHLASLAHRAGLDGVVASPEDGAMIRSRFGKGFLIVTPGIRPSWAAMDDQKRALTPRKAVQQGADYLVIGRAITSQSDPIGALMRIQEELVDL